VLPCGYQRTLPRSLLLLLLLLQVSNPLTCRRYADFEAVGTLVPYGQHLRGEGSASTALSGNLRGKRCTVDHLLSSRPARSLRPAPNPAELLRSSV
jgi:hypothetical protein